MKRLCYNVNVGVDTVDMAEKIRMLRKERGLTLEEVGDRVGVGKSTVRKWESGEIANMRRDKIALLAAALGVEPSYLMGWNENEKTTDNLAPDESELLDSYRALNAAGQSIALNTVKGLAGNPDLVKDTTSSTMAG